MKIKSALKLTIGNVFFEKFQEFFLDTTSVIFDSTLGPTHIHVSLTSLRSGASLGRFARALRSGTSRRSGASRALLGQTTYGNDNDASRIEI